jgi:membrane-associated phospholipid phosphatase
VQQTQEHVARKIKGVSVRLIIVLALFVIALAGFSIIGDEAVLENETGFDKFAFHKLAAITSPTLTQIMTYITFFGSSYFLLPAYILVTAYYLLLKKNTKLSLEVSAIGLTSVGILFGIKSIFHRHRPLDPLIKNVNGFSFPSGHSFSAFTFFGLLIYIIWKTHLEKQAKVVATVFLFLFACAIALSRVYLHVHFATDAIAGFCLCIIWLTVSLWLLNKVVFTKKGAK